MSKINIIYLLPELKTASGGAKVIYNHSIILNKLNKLKISSKVVHLKKKISYKLKTSITKRINFFDNKISGWDAKQMKVSKNFKPDLKWFNKTIFVDHNIEFNKKNDFIIIPEIWSHFAVDLDFIKKDIKYAIFVQGFYHMNSTNDFLKVKKAYENAKIILTVSNYNINYLKDIFPKIKNKILKINLSINSNSFKIKKKENLITYMPRKLSDHAILLKFYLKNLLPKNWKIIPLINVSQKKLQNSLSKSKIFLSFSHLEGTGLPPIEAALSGNKVIGYTGGGGSEYWKEPIFTKIENGEIRNFGKKILHFINSNNSNWIKNTSRYRNKLIKKYSKDYEKNSLIKFCEKVVDLY